MAVKDSIGGWKDNAFIYKAAKACSTLKNFMGPEWIPYIKHNFGFNDTNCPLKRVLIFLILKTTFIVS